MEKRENRPGKGQDEKAYIVCYRCKENGHIATKCPKNALEGRPGSRPSKRVDLCIVDEPKTSMQQRERSELLRVSLPKSQLQNPPL
ncbi:hypothetical protein ACLKA7_005480 [Drosophila subpalustris]